MLASYLWEYPERDGDVDIDPSKLVDAVWRAVHGKSLTRERLELFIAAFRICDEAETLRQLWTGTHPARVIIGDLAPPDGHVAIPLAYQTIQLHEFHYLGPDGQPAHHRTVQTIRALTDSLGAHRYSFDTNEVTVERVHGGTPGTPYRVAGTLWAVDLRFPQVLSRDDTATMEYITRFHYARSVEPLFRRATHRRVEDTVIRVQFDPQKLPRAVWWTEWADYRESDTSVLRQETTKLDPEHAVHRHLELVERAVVGFMWEF